MEELIQQFKSVTEGPRVPAGEGYFAIESANGELGFYLVSDGSAVPVKVRCRPPSFINLAPMSEMLKGALLADLIPTFDFINMIGGSATGERRDRVWKQLGAPTEQVGSVNDPRTHQDFGRKWNEKWIYLDEHSSRVAKVVLWLRYDLVGAFSAADGTPLAVCED